MSTTIKVKTLQHHDLFELPNGSVYEMARRGNSDEPVQALLWCAHSPDATTHAPSLVNFPPEQEVHMLDHTESRLHIGHPGYVRTAFEQEMDRHHQASMSVVYEKMNREDAFVRQREHEQRPWWKKLFS